MAESLDVDDIQGLVFRGYGNLRAACYLLLAVDDPASARAWLRSLAGEITVGEVKADATALNVAFTPSGLRKLGLPPEALATFSLEFIDGMATPHRSRLFGDVGESAPERWDWGGPGAPEIDVLLMLFATDKPTLAALYAASGERLVAGGLRQLAKLDTEDLGFVEHFGFRDGVSQPVIAGSSRSAAPMHTIQPGEFLLGYQNEHGQVSDSPTVEPRTDPGNLLPSAPDGGGKDLGRNGSYLIFRQLTQDVRGFWRFVDQAAKNADGSSNAAERAKLAAKMVGRWRSGAPLALTPVHDDPALAEANDFGYGAADPHGFGCPIGAHVRRTNPRDSLEPSPGTQKSIDVGKRHRLMRRGREYGKPIDVDTLFDATAAATDDEERGLHFICLCGNIARQFEFIQHTWVMNEKFDGLHENADPLLGAHQAPGGTFVVQSQPVRQRVTGLPRFVTVRGGAYFFLPGLRAIRYLSNLAA
jgi:Dyp-type peroxidase family